MNDSNASNNAKSSAPKKLIAIIILLAIVVGGGYFASTSLLGGDTTDASAQKSEWFKVEKKSFDLTVVASGELAAKNQVEVKSKVKENLAIIEVIPEGSTVKKGDILCKLESKKIEDKIEAETLAVESAQTEFTNAQRNLEIEKNSAATSKKAAEVKLLMANLDYNKWKDGDVPKKERELELALKEAKKQVTRTERDFINSKQLFEEKFISLNELEDDELKMDKAKDSLITAENNITIYEDYTHIKEQSDKVTQVDTAKSSLERTIATNQSKISRIESELKSKERRLMIKKNGLEELKEQFASTTVLAPQEGLVVYGTSVGSRWSRQDPIKEGRQIRFNETIIVLPDTTQMIAKIKVHEAMLPQVKEGQEVQITIDARPGEIFSGKVSSIAIMAEEGSWMNPNLREYVVKVEMAKDDSVGLKPAMRCTGKIVVGKVEDSVAVPIQAIWTEGKNHFVYVGAKETRDIKIGRSSESFVEILEGLEAGDQVLLRNPTANEKK
ncbi:efflux RND transporter periplasmic adaptor subunit [Planctomycetota bacterium]|nr:efflux RND transporter periplasmic adaptor subunit [Planctomycetota bacterium]